MVYSIVSVEDPVMLKNFSLAMHCASKVSSD